MIAMSDAGRVARSGLLHQEEFTVEVTDLRTEWVPRSPYAHVGGCMRWRTPGWASCCGGTAAARA
jgi:hypothetical protein